MKKTFYNLTLILFLISCGYKTRKTADKVSLDTLLTISPDPTRSNFFIKDKSQYDPSFVEELSRIREPVRLIDNYIIVREDTTYFPGDLTPGNAIVFKGTKAGRNYVLTVTRENLTNLQYDFKLTGEDETVIYSRSGKSVLGSAFYLGSEMDEDSRNGEGYPSYEYWDKTADCHFALRIGHGKDDHGKLRAKLKYGGEDHSKPSLSLNECPTLRTE